MPIPTDQCFVPLLVPERLDGIQARGFLGGIKTEEDADGAGEEKGDGDNDHVDVSDFVNKGLKPLSAGSDLRIVLIRRDKISITSGPRRLAVSL